MCLFARVASNLTANESSTVVGVIDAIYTNHLNSRKGRSQQAAAQCKSQSATLRARKSLRTVTRLGENNNTEEAWTTPSGHSDALADASEHGGAT